MYNNLKNSLQYGHKYRLFLQGQNKKILFRNDKKNFLGCLYTLLQTIICVSLQMSSCYCAIIIFYDMKSIYIYFIASLTSPPARTPTQRKRGVNLYLNLCLMVSLRNGYVTFYFHSVSQTEENLVLLCVFDTKQIFTIFFVNFRRKKHFRKIFFGIIWKFYKTNLFLSP